MMYKKPSTETPDSVAPVATSHITRVSVCRSRSAFVAKYDLALTP